MTDLERVTNQRNYNRRLADHQKAVIDRLNAENAKLQDALRYCKQTATGADMMPTSVIHAIVDAALAPVDDEQTPPSAAQAVRT